MNTEDSPASALRLCPLRGNGWPMTKTISAFILVLGLGLTLSPAAAHALDFGGLAKKATGAAAGGARDKAVKEVNAKLLAEGRKNQCSFKTDSDELAPGCDSKLKKLANALVDAKKRLNVAGVTSFKFEVSGHTDSSGKPEHNKELSGKRAAVIQRELVARGIAKNEIIAVGMGSERPLVTPDNTPAKKAKNRRYEIQLRF
jgi:OOP family OmpA-OmpF porin